jgi:hypothetical protein
LTIIRQLRRSVTLPTVLIAAQAVREPLAERRPQSYDQAEPMPAKNSPTQVVCNSCERRLQYNVSSSKKPFALHAELSFHDLSTTPMGDIDNGGTEEET